MKAAESAAPIPRMVTTCARPPCAAAHPAQLPHTPCPNQIVSALATGYAFPAQSRVRIGHAEQRNNEVKNKKRGIDTRSENRAHRLHDKRKLQQMQWHGRRFQHSPNRPFISVIRRIETPVIPV